MFAVPDDARDTALPLSAVIHPPDMAAVHSITPMPPLRAMLTSPLSRLPSTRLRRRRFLASDDKEKDAMPAMFSRDTMSSRRAFVERQDVIHMLSCYAEAYMVLYTREMARGKQRRAGEREC